MHPMIQLLARNRRVGEFRAESNADDATIYLYDYIVESDDEAEFWGGVSPQAFTKALRAMTAPTIHVRVNSPGGSVFAARAIEQALREHDSHIVVHVDGYAASAASFLIMGADEIEMAPGAFLMIHKAWTFAAGNAEDLVGVASLLEQIDASLVKTYAARSGQAAADIEQWMAAETWLDAERAVELHLADRVAGEGKAQARARWDVSAYAHAPAAVAEPVPTAPVNTGPDRDALHRAALRKLIPA